MMFTKRGICVVMITGFFVFCLTIFHLDENHEQNSLLSSIGIYDRYSSVRSKLSFRRQYTGSTQDSSCVVLFSAPQKCAGRTIYELVEYISNLTRSAVTRDSIMNIDSVWPPNVSAADIVPRIVRERVHTSQPLDFIYTHLSFVEFGNDSLSPSYVSIVRDPFERARSFYYFKRYGDTMQMTEDAKLWRQRMEKMNLSKDSYDDCVMSQRLECVGERSQFELIRHFCGYSEECYRKPETVLEIAKRNIENHYAIVGITEEFDDFLSCLEVLFPVHFNNASKFYNTETFKKIVYSTRTKIKLPASSATKNIMLPKLKYEYELYYFIKQRFHDFKEKILNEKRIAPYRS